MIIVLRTRAEFDEALEYIHMNPVVKGLVQEFVRVALVQRSVVRRAPRSC